MVNRVNLSTVYFHAIHVQLKLHTRIWENTEAYKTNQNAIDDAIEFISAIDSYFSSSIKTKT
jgi:hypothetical protein